MRRILVLLALVFMTLGSIPAQATGTDNATAGDCGSDNATD